MFFMIKFQTGIFMIVIIYFLFLAFFMFLSGCSVPGYVDHSNDSESSQDNNENTPIDPVIIQDDAVTIINNCPPVPDGYGNAKGNGTCYYIDPVNGNDNNPGTFKNPWRTTKNINTYLPWELPDNWVQLSPGDVVYFMEGIHTQVFTGYDSYYPDAIIKLWYVNGDINTPIVFRNYPGHHTILDPEYNGSGIIAYGCSYIQIEGLEIRNSYSRGVLLRETENMYINNLLVHDTDGLVIDNIAGVEICYSSYVEIENSIIYNNYDRTAAKTGTQNANSCNMVLFTNSGLTSIHNNIFLQTGDSKGYYTGGGIKYKHSSQDPNSVFELFGNYFENHKYFAVGIGTHHAYVHHNIINGVGDNSSGAPAYAIDSRDWGGNTHQQFQLFEYNTIYTDKGFSLYPTLDYINDLNIPQDDLNNNTFRNNIVFSTADGTDNFPNDPPMQIYTAISDELYLELLDGIIFENNCYYNSQKEMRWGYAESINYGALGGNYNLTEW